ncbi:hypothetical protein HFO32_10700 [Rhizobium leguminosarum]|uniref:hypothetical protein n=1 Tax=Rhizobium leguminosarum TaxID=384 RepID=UPI001C982E7B|nr:hypothetical protein [Rhizobium leguminosarum]MBY5682625.1 hypothetical protein [Rhizobium leguminosarum]
MFAVLGAMARLIGIGGVLFIGLLIYEEGIPGADRIPFLTSIPIVGDLTAGRVHTYAAQQVKLATSNMVTKFERDTIASQLAEERRRSTEAAQIAEEYRKRADAALRENEQAQDKLEKAIAEDTGTDSPNWSDADLQWLCEHGSTRYCGR